MKIFDGHADIWYDVAQKRLLGEEDIFKKYHLNRFKSGNVIGGIFIAYLDHKEELDDKHQMIQMINATMHEISRNKDLFNIIRKSGDFEIGLKNDKINVLMGVEGLRAIDTDLDWLDTLYALGFRHCSLTWNEQNALGTGVAGDINKGLTQTGKNAIKKMENLGMIVDCSHANKKTFWDIYENTTKPFIASHSNAKALCDHRRNLTDEQIKAIGKRDGVIGINAFKQFISKNENLQNIEGYIDQIEYIIKLTSINNVGLGFDFCEYLYRDKSESELNPQGLENASKAFHVLELLEKRGYSQEDIEKIAYKNFERVINTILKKAE